jgi:predicted component of type VI protein secretion system
VPFLDHAGTLRELLPGDTLVGSGSQAGWRLQNDGLAARHFTVSVQPDSSATIRPHSAATIVLVNGVPAPLEPSALAHGDVVVAGDATFRFLARLPQGIASAPAPHLGQERAAANERSREETIVVRLEKLVRVRGQRGAWWIVAALLALAAFTAAAALFLLQ